MPVGQMPLMQRLVLTLLQAVTPKVCKKDTCLQAMTLRYTKTVSKIKVYLGGGGL